MTCKTRTVAQVNDNEKEPPTRFKLWKYAR